MLLVHLPINLFSPSSTHDTQLLSVISIMGLLKDVPQLSAQGPVKSNRLWQYSSISPMGGQLAVERLQCSDGDAVSVGTVEALLV